MSFTINLGFQRFWRLFSNKLVTPLQLICVANWLLDSPNARLKCWCCTFLQTTDKLHHLNISTLQAKHCKVYSFEAGRIPTFRPLFAVVFQATKVGISSKALGHFAAVLPASKLDI